MSSIKNEKPCLEEFKLITFGFFEKRLILSNPVNQAKLSKDRFLITSCSASSRHKSENENVKNDE